jgi:hypothetical protein
MTSTQLVDIKERIKQQMIAARSTVPAPAGRNISTKGKIFTLPDKRTHPGPLQAVILDWRNFNAYYKAAYNANKPEPPHCFAMGMEIEAMTPHEGAKEPQCERCADCAFNKFGSAPGGGRGKACRNMVKLAVAAPDATRDTEPMILKVSPTGLTRWAGLISNYDVLGKHPMEHITEIAFDPNESYPTLTFRPGDALSDESLSVFWFLREKAQTLLNAQPISGD